MVDHAILALALLAHAADHHAQVLEEPVPLRDSLRAGASRRAIHPTQLLRLRVHAPRLLQALDRLAAQVPGQQVLAVVAEGMRLVEARLQRQVLAPLLHHRLLLHRAQPVTGRLEEQARRPADRADQARRVLELDGARDRDLLRLGLALADVRGQHEVLCVEPRLRARLLRPDQLVDEVLLHELEHARRCAQALVHLLGLGLGGLGGHGGHVGGVLGEPEGHVGEHADQLEGGVLLLVGAGGGQRLRPLGLDRVAELGLAAGGGVDEAAEERGVGGEEGLGGVKAGGRVGEQLEQVQALAFEHGAEQLGVAGARERSWKIQKGRGD